MNEVRNLITFLDFETNGFQGSDVLSIGLRHSNGEVFNRFYFPQGEYKESAIAINGLTKERVTELRGDATYPAHFKDDEEVISLFEQTDILVAHNIEFDYSFLPDKVKAMPLKLFCTMKGNTKYFQKNPKLIEAAEHYNIPVDKEGLHGAAYDVLLCQSIYEAMDKKDKPVQNDCLTKVYAARNAKGEKIHPFGSLKGLTAKDMTLEQTRYFLAKYDSPEKHEMFDDVEIHHIALTRKNDNQCVDAFSKAMKAKLAFIRAKGWDDKEICTDEGLATLFFEHLQKCNEGNFIDLANFLMFLHIRGADASILKRQINITNVENFYM